MTLSPTMPEGDLPWQPARRSGGHESLHLVLAWSLEEPDRIGESAVLKGLSVLGRGGPQSDDPHPRLVFHQRRPAGAEPGRPLAASRVSRVQLRLEQKAGTLAVTSVGKCTLFVNGVETKAASVEAGDVLVLRNALVLYIVRRAAHEPLVAYPRSLASFAFGGADAHGIVGESTTMWRLRDQLALGAQSPHHVLISGASGSGKELAARALHGLSSARQRKMVARNAATFPEGLVDAELFGTAKNYPQAGSPERPGLIAEADGSSLFLDEIGELPAALQAHLLRVLDQDGEYQRLGESKSRQAKLRVIAATNRDLGTLKHDLAARFASRVEVPSLSERREDVPLLVRHVLARLVRESPALRARFFEERGDLAPVARMDPHLIEALLRHDYTHHLRELERLLWRAVSTSGDAFVALTPEVSAELRVPPVRGGGEEATADEVRAALAATSGNVTRTAEKLGLKNRYALYRLLKRHGIALAQADDEDTGSEPEDEA